MDSQNRAAQTVNKLKREVKLLRSFMIGAIIEDKEGEYEPSFVKKILKDLEEPSAHHFRGPQSFLQELRNAK